MSLAVLLLLVLGTQAYPSLAFTSSEQGVKEADLTSQNQYMTFAKSLYKNAEILVHIVCEGDAPAAVPTGANATRFRIGWRLRQSPCAEEYTGVDKDARRAPLYYEQPELVQVKEFNYKQVKTKKFPDWNQGDADQCLVCHPGQTTTLLLKNVDQRGPSIIATKFNRDGSSLSNFTDNVSSAASSPHSSASAASGSSANKKPTSNGRRKRKAAAPSAGKKVASTKAPATTPAPPAGKAGLITRTWEDGIYLLVLHAYECDTASLPNNFQVRARVEIVNRFGYLSAIDWPLLPFFGSMCLLYLLFGLLWLGLCAKYWREMLRIQFCISGVIFLGMLEKALFYAEYQSINSTGVSVRGAVMLAELVSCVKRSVARMLVLIVCLGYGIVKPRLGQLQHKVIAIGLVYFIFSAVESSIRAMRPRFDQSRNAFYATIPLAVTDAIICWWIFSSLVQTIRNLRVRRNLVKLSLYRHFTNTLVFCVVCSVVFMTWTVSRHKFALCIAAWRELWIDDAFWHLLFSVILFVIIILWRPSQNNQRYAFTPLLDAGNDSDEDEEVVMDNLAEGVKARGSGASAQQQQQQQRSRQSSKGEDSLRWVEENIPQSLVESTLPSLLQDSDEEVLTTKYEMSKLL
ncbi:hypothetical protein BOX15_Mlig019358g3 [Macrostomum lignano]|uniref:GOST seven transmembrane domain-containing protein n=1 Tax=Macrostomum lignano TaxID=282301 RepID=A0A267F300_9PLAT|nr:hypothetical protein BOX15_Mlig019358g3 [Macrostomum lignano]